MTATLTQSTTDIAAPARIRIVGSEAREIAQHVRAYVKPGREWSEVQAMRECAYGCKLYVRKQGCVTRYALIHSAAYGCPLGYASADRTVPVSVTLNGKPTPSLPAARWSVNDRVQARGTRRFGGVTATSPDGWAAVVFDDDPSCSPNWYAEDQLIEPIILNARR